MFKNVIEKSQSNRPEGFEDSIRLAIVYDNFWNPSFSSLSFSAAAAAAASRWPKILCG